MKQKDWIIYNKHGHLWCLAIQKTGDNAWYLIEWVNFQGLSQQELKKMVDMGYHTMLQAALKQDEYRYVIGRYNFSPLELDSGYWRALLPDGIKGKKSTKVEIDKTEFENQVSKLFKKYHTDFEYGG